MEHPYNSQKDEPSQGGWGLSGLSAAVEEGLKTVRTMVSQDKVRFVADGFDLDLTYITDNIIAMGFPAEKIVESTYRNDINQVRQFFEKYHPGHYRIFNISEKYYDHTKLNNQVVDLGWWDHHAPTLDHLLTLVEIMDAWLNQEEDNVVAIHCRAGRGRTGTAIGALLLRRNLFETSEEALQYFARKRSIKEGGVGVPSQRRYVEYARQVFRKERDLYPVRKFYLQRILMKPVPLVDVSGTEFTPSVTVISMTDPGAPLFASTSYKTYYGTDGVIEVLIGCEVEGDILVRVFHQQNILVTTKPILVFRFQFHTNFINDNVLDFNGPKQLDSPKSGFLKDTRFSEQFVVRCVFTQIKPK